jgi:formylglycine-generating enzyme required for sulfatase activity/serine/threonine protein kinase
MNDGASIGMERTGGPARGSGAEDPTLRDGEIFGPFRVLSLLGRGAMGEVYHVKRIEDGKVFALKVIAAGLMRDDQAVARFRQEARTLCALHNANIVAADQVGEEDGRHWLTMQLCEGLKIAGADGRLRQARSLDEYVEACGGRLAQAELVAVLDDVLAGLAYAHNHGMVHRDLKPANILLTRGAKGRPFRALISDFGLVRIIGEERIREQVARSIGLSLTRAASGDEAKAWLGNWAYMSPEQKRGKPAVKGSDLYAVGLLAYRLGTGKDLGLESASELNPDLVPEWDAFIAGALEEQQELRYASAQEMRVALGLVREAWGRREAGHSSVEQGQQARYRRNRKRLFVRGVSDEQYEQPQLKLPARSMRKRVFSWAAGVGVLAFLSFASLKYFQSHRAAERGSQAQATKLKEVRREKVDEEQLQLEKMKAEVTAAHPLSQQKTQSENKTAEAEQLRPVAEKAASGKGYPVDVLKPFENSLGMQFMPVPGTQKLFCIWETRVQDFEAFVKETGYDATAGMCSLRNKSWGQNGDTWDSPGFEQGPTQPVCGVSWEDANAFCEWLTKRERTSGLISRDQFYCLPKDWEWSMAVGLNESQDNTPQSKFAKITRIYPWDKGRGTWPPPQRAGNYCGMETGGDAGRMIDGYDDGYRRTAPVGSFEANANGLYDLGGNLWEWCEDFYNGLSGPRVLRGGCWDFSNNWHLLSSYRLYYDPRHRYLSFGFRVVLASGGASASQAVKPLAVPVEQTHVQPLNNGTNLVAATTNRTDPLATQEVDLGQGVKIELVWCPAGSFMMGSPESETDRDLDEKQHRVTLTKGFWLGKTEVTQRQWEAVMGSNPSYSPKGANFPMRAVMWDSCQVFIKKLNERLQAGNAKPENFRLPTEAEWEYACRAGTATTFHYGDRLDASMANVDGDYYSSSGATNSAIRKRTVEVGSFVPNAWGLFDMHGNVSEWCQDVYGDYPTGSVTDPKGPDSGLHRVNRGGDWYNISRYCRSAARYRFLPNVIGTFSSFGLRLARDPVPQDSSEVTTMKRPIWSK